MSKRITVREQRTMFQPCSACGALLAFGSTFTGVSRAAFIAFGIASAQARRRMVCVRCPVGSFYRPTTIAEAIRNSRSLRLRGAA